jgi:hypothetical protein
MRVLATRGDNLNNLFTGRIMSAQSMSRPVTHQLECGFSFLQYVQHVVLLGVLRHFFTQRSNQRDSDVSILIWATQKITGVIVNVLGEMRKVKP